MIKLENVNKYFNKHKKNEIHVINNASFSLPDCGLVAILGPSGSGKTTLLNAIGGLDKVSSGNIYIDDKKISNRSIRKIDEIRNLNIGYIFQDYKLVEDMNVYDNVALSLKIIGIKDKKEIDKRVIYTLEKVNMARYKNRPVSMLSGGERQRVGIARSLVKNPRIIIADEPTGNLDSKNSLEIMNIIKSISKKYLVVLVTHEEELARFYADRIIEIKDGIVTHDYENKHNNSLNYEIDSRIYLKDFDNISKLKKDNINVQVYQNNDDKIDIKLIIKNGNIYIKSSNNERLEVIDSNSNIEVIDDHYKEIKNVNYNDTTFDIENIGTKVNPKYSSIFKLGEFIGHAFKKILNYSLIKKILLGGFFIAGMFVFYSVSTTFASLEIKDEDFIRINKKYLTVVGNKISVNDYLSYEKLNNVNYAIPGDSVVNFQIYYDKYLQTQHSFGVISGSLSSIKMINNNDLFMGRMPSNEYEIVIDKMVLDNFIKNYSTNTVGFNNLEDYLNHLVYVKNMKPFKIVGISNVNEPNIYCNESLFIDIVNNGIDNENDSSYINYNLVKDEIRIVKGRAPVEDYEVILYKDSIDFIELNKNIDVKVNDKKLKVVGFYDNNTYAKYKDYITNENTIKYNLINKNKNISIYSSNNDEVIKYLKDNKVNVYSSYDYSKDNYIKSKYDNIKTTLGISSIILAISLLEILLMIRSSFLSRIKEVGIYRAIGVKKSDIYKMFMGEILIITFTANLLGISFMAYILSALNSVPYIKGMFMVNIFTYLLSFILVLIFNLIVGLFPVFNTIRKMPAEILSRKDVD